ncbi:hypothetical protein [Streptococcus pluranimalium]|uniref:hypothetical protein n=1 Tax=Streptococcus pluranimalium TaxID=82348 RepID=UPI003F692D77
MGRQPSQTKLKKAALELYGDFLELFDEVLAILNQGFQKKTGRSMPQVLQIALRQYYEEDYARLSILMRGNSFTMDEAFEISKKAMLLKYSDTDREQLEKLLLASRL